MVVVQIKETACNVVVMEPVTRTTSGFQLIWRFCYKLRVYKRTAVYANCLRTADTGVVGNIAVFVQRHIEVHANDSLLAVEIVIVDSCHYYIIWLSKNHSIVSAKIIEIFDTYTYNYVNMVNRQAYSGLSVYYAIFLEEAGHLVAEFCCFVSGSLGEVSSGRCIDNAS